MAQPDPYTQYEDLASALREFGLETELVRPDGPEYLRLEAPAGTMIGVEWLDVDHPDGSTEFAVFLLESNGETLDDDEYPHSVLVSEEETLEGGLEILVKRILREVIAILE